MAYQAVIFDMDGVLVDSEPAFFEAANDVLRPTGKQIEWERYQQLLGTSISVTWRSIMEMIGEDADPEAFAKRYSDVLPRHLSIPRPLLPGVRALIDRLTSDGTPVGLATSSRQEWLEALLNAANLPLASFDALVWRQMVAKGKPAPDLYLKAAELLGVPPARCIAIEDTPTGIASAQAAGMFAVQVRSASTAFPPIEEANLVIDSLEQFPPELVDGARRGAL